MKTILLTAFEPFGGLDINASQEVMAELRSSNFETARVEFLSVPVERFRSAEVVIHALRRIKPDVVIMLGEARNRDGITPERVAINVDDFRIPDNGENQPVDESIVADGPAAYFSTLPIRAIKTALDDEGIVTSISNTAGTYVCNHLFYRVMHEVAQMAIPPLAGFIHIPQFTEQKPPGAENWPSLPRATVIKGVRLAVETCA